MITVTISGKEKGNAYMKLYRTVNTTSPYTTITAHRTSQFMKSLTSNFTPMYH